jgi:hypothetical protein
VASHPLVRRVLIGIPLALSCGPLVLVATLVAQHARNVPWKDQWGMAGFISEAAQGIVRPVWLFWQVNEHRMPVAFVLQGALAWWTRWDLRYEAYLNVALAGLTLLVLAALARRTIATRSATAAAWAVLACAVLTFEVAGGSNWTWGTMNANFLVGLASALLAWQLAGWTGRWRQTIALAATATLAAFTFGAGLVLLLAVPAALALPTERVPQRGRHALATAVWAVLVIGLYFTDWHPRIGHPPAVLYWDRLSDYGTYLLAYLGAVIGTRSLAETVPTAVALATLLIAGSGWVWWSVPTARAAVVPWLVLAGTAVTNAVVTAYGRMGDGIESAVLIRYLPTASWFAIGLVGVTAIALAELSARSPRTSAVLVALLALGIAGVSPTVYRTSRQGIGEMAALASRLDRGAPCLTDCSTAPDACLLLMCWDARVARAACQQLSVAGIGPFAAQSRLPP